MGALGFEPRSAGIFYGRHIPAVSSTGYITDGSTLQSDIILPPREAAGSAYPLVLDPHPIPAQVKVIVTGARKDT